MFWLVSALLIVVAILLIVPALFKREQVVDATREQNISVAQEQLAELEMRFEKGKIDQQNYQSTRDELEIALFNDLKNEDEKTLSTPIKNSSRFGSLFILLLIPLITIPVYLNLGQIEFTKHLDSKETAKGIVKFKMPLKPDGTPDIEKIVEHLQNKMQKNPSDPNGWYMLGRSYMLLKRYPEAASSFEKSLALRPELADTMLSLADALSMQNNGQLNGRSRELVNKALTIEPNNVTALWLSGMAANQAKEYSRAISQWQKILPSVKDIPQEKLAVESLIAEATSRNKDAQGVSGTSIKKETAPSESLVVDSSVKLTISLAEDIKNQVSPNDFVFIYAKALSGPPMPLAAVKKQAKDLPVKVVLNDEMAMIPDLKLSGFSEVLVGARISKTGQAIPQNGDLYAEELKIKTGNNALLKINKTYKK